MGLKFKFLMIMFLIAAPLSYFYLGSNSYDHIPCQIMGADFKSGHKLRGHDFPAPTFSQETETVIIGGGIAGLSAGRHLQKNNKGNFIVLELSDQIGGNSVWGVSGQNQFPWGAHYLPIPGQEQSYLFDFLQDANIISRFEQGVPIFKEYFICHDLPERLWINGKWQEGLVPKNGLDESELKQIDAFFERMDHYRLKKGSDGKFAFAIPSATSSKDPQFMQLDSITMAEFMDQQGFSSKALKWYVNYCCRDDYGAGIETVSAWAGIHYFASRRKLESPGIESDSVLTWPEGNGFLVKELAKSFHDKIKSGNLVYRVENNAAGGFNVYSFDVKSNQSVKIHCKNLISAVPQFIAAKIIPAEMCDFPELRNYVYAPWVVANIWAKKIPEMPGVQVAWDNVSFYSPSLGYIRANHQNISYTPQEVLTYYRPLDETTPALARADALKKTPQGWREIILNDMGHFYPKITENVDKIEVWLWGHGMIVPVVGHLKNGVPLPKVKNLYFAHSDLSGLSIFEEAFWQGLIAAQRIMKG